jgi:enoyl-CoA hydratase/carnithine racemase
MPTAARIATTIAEAPALATQGTLRSLWMGRELSRRQALDQAYLMTALGTDKASLAEGQERFSSGARMEWRLR